MTTALNDRTWTRQLDAAGLVHAVSPEGSMCTRPVDGAAVSGRVLTCSLCAVLWRTVWHPRRHGEAEFSGV